MKVAQVDPCWPNLDVDEVSWSDFDDEKTMVSLHDLVTFLIDLYRR